MGRRIISPEQAVVAVLIVLLFAALGSRENRIVVQDCAPGTWKMEKKV